MRQQRLVLAAAAATTLATIFAGSSDVLAQSAGVAAFNETLSKQWDSVARPLVERELGGKLAGLAPKKVGPLEIEKIENISLDLAKTPRAATVSRDRLEFLLPGQRGWRIRARARLKFSFRLFGAPIGYRAPLDIDVSEFQARVSAPLSSAHPEEPRIADVRTDVSFRLRLSSPDFVLGLAARGLTALVDGFLRGPILALLSEIFRQKVLPTVLGRPTPLGTGGPSPVAPAPSDLARRAAEIDARIQRDSLPYGTLLVTHYSSPNPGEGTVTGYSDFGDSAIWTGHYLMSQAFRYRATKDPAARAGALRALGGIDDLFEVTGRRGILARAVAPASSPEGQTLLAAGSLVHRGVVDGVDSVGWGADFISRDQYVGVMAGMGFADLAIDEPAVHAMVKENVSRAVSRMLEKDWAVYFDDGRFSVSFLSRFEQQLAFLALAKRVDPTRFAAAFERHAPTAELVWFPLWTETFDPHGSYYKFNLDHTSLALVMTLDAEPTRWREYHRGLRILRRALDHHENAWFQTVELLVDPASRPALAPRTRAALDQWATRNVRAVSLDPAKVAALPSVPWFDSKNGIWIRIAKHPVPIPLRGPTDFLWQRSPFGLGVASSPHAQFCGVDLILPYWIGRDLGLYP